MPEKKSNTIMNTFHKKRLFILLSALAIVWSSCVNDVWQEHYDNTDKNLSTENLADLIKGFDELSVFNRMLETTGYDSILKADQSYTVWAPVNSAFDQIVIDWTDTASINEIVCNHIARFNYPTAGYNTVSSKKVYMLSGKFVPFEKVSTGFTFGTFSIDTTSLLANNGILHILNGYVPYASNIWESLGRIAGLDSVYAYLNPLGSTPFGDINNEDSVYTAILPNNQAWIKSYEVIKKYFVCLPSATRDSSKAKQRRLTQNAIMQDAFFKFPIPDPSPYVGYSIVNTSNHLFTNFPRLFEGATPHKASNGYVWVSDSLRNTATESWHREIRVEAENTAFGRTSQNANVYWRSSENTGFTISNNRYVVVFPLTTSTIQKVFVYFPIPNTLSATYKIYCVFAPAAITEAKPLPCLVNFYMDYVNSAGTKIVNQSISTNVVTSGTEVSKVFVKEMTFPYCNLVTPDNIGDITVKLKVENAAKETQSTIYTRTMRIDCIILEPVN
jgi:uncharacterized surface protein with fasciclin (FAS1) repeats